MKYKKYKWRGVGYDYDKNKNYVMFWEVSCYIKVCAYVSGKTREVGRRRKWRDGTGVDYFGVGYGDRGRERASGVRG